jgi:hypothetical protein
MNPSPGSAGHTLVIDDRSRSPSLERAMATRVLYRLTEEAARDMCEEVRDATSNWATFAERAGIDRAEIGRMHAVMP